MQTKFNSLTKRPVVFLTMWVLVLFLAMLLSVFVHEIGHGLGARLEGLHVSTGFNQVGDPGKSPNDPDFRSETETKSNNILGGLLGPMASWTLAILFTIWLYRFKQPSWGAMIVNAMAITNGFVRALPMFAALFFSLMGTPRLEDEVQWGMWVVVKYCQPPSLSPSMSFHTMLGNYSDIFYREPVFWIAPLISLLISLACLIPAYLKTIRLWREELYPIAMWSFALLAICKDIADNMMSEITARTVPTLSTHPARGTQWF